MTAEGLAREATMYFEGVRQWLVSTCDASLSERLEMELRLGFITKDSLSAVGDGTGVHFQSGVRCGSAEQLSGLGALVDLLLRKHWSALKPGFPTSMDEPEHTTVAVYPQDGWRLITREVERDSVMGPETILQRSWERKQKTGPPLDYLFHNCGQSAVAVPTVRISMALEEPEDFVHDKPPPAAQEPVLIRDRRCRVFYQRPSTPTSSPQRSTLSSSGSHPMLPPPATEWRIDVTEVTTTWVATGAVEYTLEVEFEWLAHVRRQLACGQLSTRNFADCNRKAVCFFAQICFKIMDLAREHERAAAASMTMSPASNSAANVAAWPEVTDPQWLRALRDEFALWMPGLSMDNKQFPGSMAVNVQRRHLPALQAAARSGVLWVTPKNDGIRVMLWVNAQGELFGVDRRFAFLHWPGGRVYVDAWGSGTQLVDGEWMPDTNQYVIFDAIIVRGRPVHKDPLQQRLAKAADLMQAWRPCEMQCKQYVPAAHLTPEFAGAPGTDGLILQCEGDYQPGPGHLFKWKPVPTIDLRPSSSPTDNAQTFWTRDEHCTYPLCLASEEDRARLLRDRPLVAEFAWYAPTGTWRYARARPDKRDANTTQVVFSTLEVIAERLGADELCRLLSS
jgi:hypothetical protein